MMLNCLTPSRSRGTPGGEFFALNEVGRQELIDQPYVSSIEDLVHYPAG
jgi:hypothetical protein